MTAMDPRGITAASGRRFGDRLGLTQIAAVGIIGLLVVGVAATLFLLLERHRDIGSVMSDSGLWVALQFDRDARKLKDAAWAVSLRPDDDDALETVELRYDILYARADLLTKGQAGERVAGDPELSELVSEIVGMVEKLEEPIFGLRDRVGGVDDALLARFDEFLETTEDLVQKANVKMGLMSVDEREETLQLYQYLAAFVVVSALLTIAFVVALVRTSASNTALRRVEADRARHISILRTLIDNMPQGVSLRDADGNLVLWNDNLRRMFNLPSDFFDVPRHGDDIVRYQEEHGLVSEARDYRDEDGTALEFQGAYVATNLRDRRYRYELARPDGRVIDVHHVPLPDGSIIRTSTDITALRRAEAERERQSALLTTTLEHMNNGLLVLDRDKRIILYGPRTCDFLNIPAAFLDTKPTNSEMFRYLRANGDYPEDDDAAFEERLKRLDARFDVPEPFVYERRRPDGRWLQVSNTPLPDGGWVRNSTDITALKKAQEDLEAERDRAHRQGELLQHVLDTVDQGVVLMDSNDVQVLTNRRYCEYLDMPEWFMSQPVTMAEIDTILVERGELWDLPPDHFEREAAWLRGDDPSERFAYERQRPDGRWLLVTTRKMSDGGGQVRTFTDITDRKLAEVKAAEQTALLELTLEGMDQGILLTDADRQIILQNTKTADLIGVPEWMLDVGRSFQDVVDLQFASGELEREPEGFEEWARIQAETAIDSESRAFVYERRRPNGRWLHVDMKVLPNRRMLATYRDVTDRKEAEAEAAEQARLLALALESMDQGIILLDPDHKILLKNSNTAQILGVPDHLIQTGASYLEVLDHQQSTNEFEKVPPELQAEIDDHFARARSGQVRSFAYERERPNGRWVQIDVKLLPDAHHLATYRDNTELKRAERETAYQKRFLELVLDSVEQGILVTEADGTISLSNRRVAEIIEVDYEFLQSKPNYRDLLRRQQEIGDYDVDDVETKAILDELTAWLDHGTEGETLSQERTIANGRRLSILGRKLSGGRSVRTVTDITQRFAAEEARRTLMEAIPVPIVMSDVDTHDLIYTNPAASALYGIRVGGAASGNLETVYARMEDRRKLLGLLQREGSVDEYEIELRGPGGETIWVLAHGRMITHDGKRAALVASYPITERKQLEHELALARDVAEDASRAKSAFLASMSHEIRTPLSGITGFLELLQYSELDTDQRRMVRSANLAARALIDLIGDVLDFSKIEAGHLDLHVEEVSPRALLAEIISVVTPRAMEKMVRLASQIAPDVPEMLSTDPTRLRQILVNLVGNAVKFTETGIVHIEALVETAADGRHMLRFEVIDTGVGFESEQAETLFDEFRQVDGTTTRKYGGTGLGLAISKRLVELLGGEIGCHAEPDRGALFWFTLPIGGPISRPRADARGDDLRVLVGGPPSPGRTLVMEHLEAHGCSVLDNDGAVDGAGRGPLVVDAIVLADNGVGPVDQGLDVEVAPTHVVLVAKKDFETMERALHLGFDIILEQDDWSSSLIRQIKEARRQVLEMTTAAPTPRDPVSVSEALDPALARLPILVIDDIEMNRDIACRQLAKLGLIGETAANGAEGLELATRDAFSLILVDISMPVMDGFEFATRFRAWEQQQGATRRMPVIALTANVTTEDAQRCFAVGMDDHIAKPFSIDRISTLLRTYLGPRGDWEGPASTARPAWRDPGEAAGAEEIGQGSAQRQEGVSAASVQAPQFTSASASLASVASAEPAVDLDALRDLYEAEDDQELVDLIAQFLETADPLLVRINEATGKGDRADLKRGSHGAAGSARYICAPRLSESFTALEIMSEAGDWTDIRRQIALVEERMADLKQFYEVMRKTA